MGSRGSGNVCIENSDNTAEFLVGFVQLFSGKTVTLIEIMTLVAYPLSTVHLNLSAGKGKWFLENEYVLKRFLSVSCTQESPVKEEGVENETTTAYGFMSLMTVPLQSGLRITADSEGRE